MKFGILTTLALGLIFAACAPYEAGKEKSDGSYLIDPGLDSVFTAKSYKRASQDRRPELKQLYDKVKEMGFLSDRVSVIMPNLIVGDAEVPFSIKPVKPAEEEGPIENVECYVAQDKEAKHAIIRLKQDHILTIPYSIENKKQKSYDYTVGANDHYVRVEWDNETEQLKQIKKVTLYIPEVDDADDSAFTYLIKGVKGYDRASLIKNAASLLNSLNFEAKGGKMMVSEPERKDRRARLTNVEVPGVIGVDAEKTFTLIGSPKYKYDLSKATFNIREMDKEFLEKQEQRLKEISGDW